MQSTKRSVFPLKKSIALIMALSVLVCGVFAACSSKKTDGQNSAADTTQAGLANADTEFGTEINKDGKEVDVVYEKDKKGKNHAYEINKNGEKVNQRQIQSGRKRYSGSIDRRCQSSSKRTESATVSFPGRCKRQSPATADDEHLEWWCTCSQHGRCTGIHDHACRRSKLQRRSALVYRKSSTHWQLC